MILYTFFGDRMIVYVDLVFLLNIILDFILLMSVSVTLCRNTSIKRIFLGSLMGGVSTLLLFINVHAILLFFLKLLLGILMVIITFKFKNIKYTFNNMFYLYTISFSVGGVLFLLMNKGIYNYIILIIGFFIVCYLYIKQIKKLKNNYSNYYEVSIYFHNEVIRLSGYLDTGNKLYDNYKRRPIILIDKKVKYKDEEIIYVPYISLNNESVLKCLKVEKVVINNHIFNNYLVGLSNKKFQIDAINCILHSKMKGELNA